MQYVVRARPIVAEMARFWSLLNDGSVETQEPDGAEIVASMKRAVVNEGRVEWYETCFCTPPLRHERSTIYDQFFEEMEMEPTETPVRLSGQRFWDYLRESDKSQARSQPTAKESPRYVPVRIL